MDFSDFSRFSSSPPSPPSPPHPRPPHDPPHPLPPTGKDNDSSNKKKNNNNNSNNTKTNIEILIPHYPGGRIPTYGLIPHVPSQPLRLGHRQHVSGSRGNARIESTVILPLHIPAHVDLKAVKRQFAYLVTWPDNPHLQLPVPGTEILDYVTPRTLEDYEYGEWLKKENARDEAEREAREATQSKVNNAANIGSGSIPATPIPATLTPATLTPATFTPGESAAKRKRGRPRNNVMMPPPSPPRPTMMMTGPSLSTPQKHVAQVLDEETGEDSAMDSAMDTDGLSRRALAAIQRDLDNDIDVEYSDDQGLYTTIEDSELEQPPRKRSRGIRSGSNSSYSNQDRASRMGRFKSIPHTSIFNPNRSRVATPSLLQLEEEAQDKDDETDNLSNLGEKIPTRPSGFPNVVAGPLSHRKPPRLSFSPSPRKRTTILHKPKSTPIFAERQTKTKPMPSNGAPHINTTTNVDVEKDELEEEAWEVKTLQGHKDIDGQRYYLVLWKGDWPAEQNPTWEPMENVSKNLIKLYLSEKDRRKHKRGKRDRRRRKHKGVERVEKMDERQRKEKVEKKGTMSMKQTIPTRQKIPMKQTIPTKQKMPMKQAKLSWSGNVLGKTKQSGMSEDDDFI